MKGDANYRSLCQTLEVRFQFLTALLCFFTLFVEVTLDPSTLFVRSNVRPVVGKLVLTKLSLSSKGGLKKSKESASELHLGTTKGIKSQKSKDCSTQSDVMEFGSADAHVGHLVELKTLVTPNLTYRFIPPVDSYYPKLYLDSPERPPLA